VTRSPGRCWRSSPEEILDGVDRLVVELDDDVAGLEASLGGRGALPYLHDQDPGGLVQAELGGA
jgi:hypothetical protein